MDTHHVRIRYARAGTWGPRKSICSCRLSPWTRPGGASRVHRCTCSHSRYFHFRQSAPSSSVVGRHGQEGTGASGRETRGDHRPEVEPYAEETAWSEQTWMCQRGGWGRLREGPWREVRVGRYSYCRTGLRRCWGHMAVAMEGRCHVLHNDTDHIGSGY